MGELGDKLRLFELDVVGYAIIAEQPSASDRSDLRPGVAVGAASPLF